MSSNKEESVVMEKMKKPLIIASSYVAVFILAALLIYLVSWLFKFEVSQSFVFASCFVSGLLTAFGLMAYFDVTED